MRIRYEADPPFEVIARRIEILPVSYRLHVWGIGNAAVARHVALRAKRNAPVAKGKQRFVEGVGWVGGSGTLKRSIKARRVMGHWIGGRRRIPRSEGLVFTLVPYARS